MVGITQEFKRLSKGGATFLPTEISESIVMPNEEFMVTFRDSKFIKHIPLQNWFNTCKDK